MIENHKKWARATSQKGEMLEDQKEVGACYIREDCELKIITSFWLRTPIQ